MALVDVDVSYKGRGGRGTDKKRAIDNVQCLFVGVSCVVSFMWVGSPDKSNAIFPTRRSVALSLFRMPYACPAAASNPELRFLKRRPFNQIGELRHLHLMPTSYTDALSFAPLCEPRLLSVVCTASVHFRGTVRSSTHDSSSGVYPQRGCETIPLHSYGETMCTFSRE